MTLSVQAVLRMAQGYQLSAILRAGLDLGVFDHLGPHGADAAEVANGLGTDVRGTRIILEALSALGLLEQHEGHFRLGHLAQERLVAGASNSLADPIRLYTSDDLWRAMGTLADAVRCGGTMLADRPETRHHPYWEQYAAALSGFMGPSSAAMARILTPWAQARPMLNVLDVGCGNGAYGYAIAASHAGARVCSLDWPNVLPAAREQAKRLGVLDRVIFIEGDMHTVALDGPYDLAILSNVLHQFSLERCSRLLGRIARHLISNGRIVIHDLLSCRPEEPAAHRAAALFSVLMLVWTTEGEAHSLGEYQALLKGSGFGVPVVYDVPGLPSKVILADRLAVDQPHRAPASRSDSGP
ncbi:MAG TPA: methyltransferase [Chloroflexota bacterium]